MTLREPKWGRCEQCGEPTARVLVGPTMCFECSQKEQRIAEAMAEFVARMPEEFAWADFDVPLLAGRVPSIACAKGLQALSSKRVAITGEAGSGKTSLAVAMARRWVSLNGRAPVILTSWRLGSARMRPDGAGDVAEATAAPLLVLDDLGSERDVPSSPVCEVIHERHAHSRPTWITTWMDHKDVRARYGDGIARRLFEGAAIIHCTEKE